MTFGSPGRAGTRALAAIDEARPPPLHVEAATRDVASLVPGLVAQTPEQLRALGALAAIAASSPRPGAELLTNMRGARNDETGESIALIRARGGGTVEVPRDPAAFLAIATRHRALAPRSTSRFTDVGRTTSTTHGAVDPAQALDRQHGAAALHRAAHRARRRFKAAAQPTQLETDGR